MKKLINLLRETIRQLERADRELKAAFEYAGTVTENEIKENYPYWW